jgi:hypothetical protein
MLRNPSCSLLDPNITNKHPCWHCKQVFKPAPQVSAPPDPPAAAALKPPGAASGSKAPQAARLSTLAAAAAAGASSQPQPQAPPPPVAAQQQEPAAMLPPELAARLNPLCLYVRKAVRLPDAPAHAAQLDVGCAPVWVRALWPPLELGSNTAQVVASRTTAWAACPGSELAPSTNGAADMHTRDVMFSAALIILAGDVGTPAALSAACSSQHLKLQLHDRTPLQETAVSSAQPQPDPGLGGEVYGCAAISLAELSRGDGATRMRFRLPLVPCSSVRGASLHWQRRPGRFMEVCAS